MTEDQYKTMVAYTQQFDEMRKVYNDQQLLDWCHMVMQLCVEDMKDGPFDPAPEEPPPTDGGDGEGEPPPPEELTMGQKMMLFAQPPSA